MKLTMTIGLSGSGKTTWALQQDSVVVCKDDIRKYVEGNEANVIEERDRLIRGCLARGVDVIAADTNLNPIHKEELQKIAKEYNAEFEIKSFLDVPVETCIQRAFTRNDGKNWRKIIKQQHRQYRRVWRETPEYTKIDYWVVDLPSAVIVDMDNTLAFIGSRDPFNDIACETDQPNYPMIDIIQGFYNIHEIVILSGRKERSRVATQNWLAKYGIRYDKLFMRPDEDNRKDSILKKEIYNTYIKDKFLVYAVFDDRPQVCKMWIEEGLPLFQFGNPYEEF